ncbi:hypothetical protein [Dactylosporangium salmoneum]|uniref:Uncharacterized protein n=1 Tax=Dactylosporangium salmoneum TaxID=53361 RepID=A0ABN3HKU0_9ACTN
MSHPSTNPGPEEPPPLRPQVPDVPQGVAYDPAQSYAVYQAVPGGGYSIPPAPYDPMVSPDYAGWWRRSGQIFKAGWKQLALVQLVGFVAGLVVAVATAVWTFGALNDVVADLNANQQAGAADLSSVWGALFKIVALALVAAMVQSAVTAGGDAAVQHGHADVHRRPRGHRVRRHARALRAAGHGHPGPRGRRVLTGRAVRVRAARTAPSAQLPATPHAQD